jgi:hypothetical protein
MVAVVVVGVCILAGLVAYAYWHYRWTHPAPNSPPTQLGLDWLAQKSPLATL